MKTPEEWIRILYTNAMCLTNNDLAKNIISDIQNEAYNQAIRDAAENAKANLYTEQGMGAYTEVDKESILKLLKR
jgi:hypothetical protein